MAEQIDPQFFRATRTETPSPNSPNSPNASRPGQDVQSPLDSIHQTEASKRLDLDELGLDGDLHLDLGLEEDDYPTSMAGVEQSPAAVRVASLTNSPGAMPARRPKAAQLPIRRVRTVRVDAWSEPASVSWGRPSKTMRSVGRPVGKVSRVSRSTDWALPF